MNMISRSSSSPLPIPSPNRMERHSATAKSHKFLRRLVHFRHMDFEFAFWQTLYLFLAPQKVYRNFQYRKQTKDQFARDDPAFLVLLSFWLVVSSIGFAIVLGFSFFEFFTFLMWVICIDCVGIGLLVATSLWILSNRYLRKPSCTDQDVEWGYAFDVHLNAFFPLLIILHVFQLIWFSVHSTKALSFFPLLIGNSLWVIAIGYYVYITFLGYSAIPILQGTQVLLYPLTALAIVFLFSLVSGWDISYTVMNFYKSRFI